MVQAARGLLREAEIETAPVDLPLVASYQGVRAVETVEMNHAGRLVPKGAGFVAQVNAAHPRGKHNFTLGHEVGHALLLQHAHERRLVEDITTGTFDGSEEEYLCDLAAAELLMPMHLLRPMAAELGCSLTTVVELSGRFHASREATARRLVDANLWPCALALWNWSYKPAQARMVGALRLPGFEELGPERKLRLQYAVANPDFGQYLHRYLAVEPDGHLMRCFSEGVSVQGTEKLKFDKGYRSFFVTAVRREYIVGSELVRDVLSLLLTEETPSELCFQPDLEPIPVGPFSRQTHA